ncbi:50S ribosomal protein L24 [Rhabdochlamydiaceae symbiont of Dictyostelium giganteum]|uniref:50S ribosomal protein L24 n=1 Tax=Rhabdochlamydiaceae symbiont of Dictyostelium giganteum TaxID=3342349 RepID=UPI00384CF9B7
MAQWIKKGDKVLVIAGNDKGRSGAVLRRRGEKVVVQGMNIRKKHVKRRSEMQTPSIIEVEMPIHISNVALCDDEGVRLKVKVKSTQKEKELIYLKEEKEVSYRMLKKS